MVWIKNNQETGTEPDRIRQQREHYKTSGGYQAGYVKISE
jgi:hypothetical protein